MYLLSCSITTCSQHLGMSDPECGQTMCLRPCEVCKSTHKTFIPISEVNTLTPNSTARPPGGPTISSLRFQPRCGVHALAPSTTAGTGKRQNITPVVSAAAVELLPPRTSYARDALSSAPLNVCHAELLSHCIPVRFQMRMDGCRKARADRRGLGRYIRGG